MAFHSVECFRHQVVIRRSNLVDHHRQSGGPAQKILGMVNIDETYTAHHRSTIGDRQSLSDMNIEGLQAVFFHHVGRVAPFSFIIYLAFANQCQCDMSQLHQIATSTYTAVFGYHGINLTVDKLDEQVHQVDMYTRFSLNKSLETCYHCSSHI